MDDAELLENAVEVITKLQLFIETIQELLSNRADAETESQECIDKATKFLSDYEKWSSEK